ncbi:ABC transporter permease [Candidatus Phytoplasma solani]|uniref:ABC-type peptide/nickel transport system, permease component n=2 Tax=Candidatus Phytoplasma solani TaxID=69896 RepID=A0A421NXQ0_9MOLU|nr:ABC transporter permease [Candidatus Phytoplasma solani]RMI88807.1 ABC-type peptide/nickel transport system, permease component [Candidatus Phytoplasma solani]CCP87977.1 ABC-type dipeptide/oligopeptide transport system, permease component [Candidatus Phytoplasma solani]
MKYISKMFINCKTTLKTLIKNKNICFGSVFLILLCLTICVWPYTSFYIDPYKSSFVRLQSFSLKHWMGTDSTGYDLFGRVLEGAKISLTISFYAVVLGSFIGSFLGIISGYFRGIIDHVINFICDILVIFPDIILAIVIMFFLQDSKKLSLVIALSISNIPSFIRIIRANTLKIKQKDFIKASKALGANNLRIIVKHVIPHLYGIIITRITIGMATVILSISALGFMGLGLDPTKPEWGNILSSQKSDMRFHSHLFFGPFIVILLTSLSFNLIGKGLIQFFNPKKDN